MRRTVWLLVLVVVLVSASGCGAGARTSLSASRSAPRAVVPTYTPTPPAPSTVHFDSPEAAMRYLAAAWNRGDVTSLRHVTDPAARELLQSMHTEATNLRLDHCTYTAGRGDYECYFTHGFPRGYKHTDPIGTAEFTVGPADKPGWYMTYFVECGG